MSNVREYIRDNTPFFGTLVLTVIALLFFFGVLFCLKEQETAEGNIVRILNDHTTKVYEQAYWDGMNDTLVHIKMTGTNKVLEITDMMESKAARIKEYNLNGGL